MSDHSGQQIDYDQYMVVTRVRKRLSVSKQKSHRFHLERRGLKKLNEKEDKEECCVEI
jgi:hypothetical protein